MNKYIFRIYQFGEEDGDNIWQSARSWEEAENIIRQEYHSIDRLERIHEER